jgi:Platelet-activating factor acetylhydrolase, isoform II
MSVGSCLFGSAVLACLLSATAAWAQQPNATSSGKTSASVPEIPYPSGPFGLGRVGYEWIDTTRPDDYDPKRKRELMVYFWYPTAKSAGAKGQYLPGAAQIDAAPAVHEMMSQEFGKSWALIVSGEISSHAIDGAPVASSRTPFPVVTFSHGLGGTGFGYTVLIEDLVSHGYVVASIEHTYTAKAVWFPDGRVIAERNDAPPAGLSQAERMSWMMKQTSVGIDGGAADVRFVIGRIRRLKHDKQHFAMAGAMDLGRVTAMGHSAGAEFAARACQQDSWIYAGVDLDGAMVPVAALPVYGDDRKIQQPLLFLEAFHPENNMGGPPNQIAEYKKVKETQLQELRLGSYDVVLRSPGIADPSFSDVPLLFHGQDGYPEPPVALHNLDLITRFVRAFLDKTVLGEKQALFDGSISPLPEAVVTAYGH